MVVTFKFNENAENVNHDANVVEGGKIHWKKVAKSVSKVANAVRKNPIVQDSAAAGVGATVLAASDNPIAGVAAAAATKAAMGGKLATKNYSLDNDIHQEIQNHMKGGKLTLKKMLNHPVTKKIYETASPIIKEAVKRHLQEMINPAEKPESVGGGFVKPKRTNPRGQQISILMKKHKITLGAASKMLKEMNEK
jgi:uncharacterized membrane protein